MRLLSASSSFVGLGCPSVGGQREVGVGSCFVEASRCAFSVLRNVHQGRRATASTIGAFANVKRATVSKVKLVSSRSAVANGWRPNPSVEGTCNGGPGWYASGEAVPPSHAPHVKRWASVGAARREVHNAVHSRSST